MYNHEVVRGSVDVRVTFHVMDSGDGTDETGYAFDTTGVDFWYQRENGSRVAITEATQTVGGAHTDGGLVHVSDGVGSLDLPDAACAVGTDGSSYVRYGGAFTGMLVAGGVVRLVPETALSGLFSGTHSNVSADLGTNAPANSIIGMTLYFPTVRQSRVVETYNTGTGVAGWTTALAAAPQDDEPWELFPTPPLDAVTIAAIQAGLATAAAVADVPTNTELDAALADADDAVLAAVAALNNLSPAQVNAQVLDVLATDTFAELSATPGATPTLATILMWLYMKARNELDNDGSIQQVKQDDGTVISEAAVSVSGGTATRGKYANP
jgi:hypothetical protein